MPAKKYHPSEIDRILKTLVILVDTREQPTERARKRYAQFGCEHERRTLKFGDYSARLTGLEGEEISLENVASVERKMDLGELCGCFCHSRERFRREFERAQTAGAHVYLLIENDDLDDAYKGAYRSKMTPRALTASIFSWCIEFGIIPLFISDWYSGRLIRDILYREARWWLEQQEVEE